MTQPRLWQRFKDRARALVPSRAPRWGLLYIPAFVLAASLGIRALSVTRASAAGLVDELMGVAPISARVMAALFFTYLLACAYRFNVPDAFRDSLQRMLVDKESTGSQRIGAFLVLAGETTAVLILLWMLLRAIILWPMVLPA